MGEAEKSMADVAAGASVPGDAFSRVTRSTEETIACGRAIGALLEEGDVLVLTGDLGAGKTQLTKGIASAMGVADDVCSPTFNIQMVYEGERMPLYHFDLYRLERADELEDTGLFDALDGDGACVIEWGEQFADELGDDLVSITLSRLDDEVAPGEEPPRRVTCTGTGARSRRLVAALADALA